MEETKTETTKTEKTIEISDVLLDTDHLTLTFKLPDLHAGLALANTIHALVYGVEEELETQAEPAPESAEPAKPRRGRPPKAKSTTTEMVVPENRPGYVPTPPAAPVQLSIPETIAPPPPPAPVQAPQAPPPVDPHVTACSGMEKSSEVVKYLFDKVMPKPVEGVKKDAVEFAINWCVTNAPSLKALSSKGDRLRTVIEQQSASIWDQRHDE